MSLTGSTYYHLCRTRAGHCLARLVRDGARALGLGRGFRLPVDSLSLDHSKTAGLMGLWQRIHWSSADGMMPGDQLLAIYDLVASWPGKGDTVELGAWVGLTTSYLAVATRVHGDGRVKAVDTFEGTKEGGSHYAAVDKYGGSTLAAFQQNVRTAGVCHLVEPIISLTDEAAKNHGGAPIRVLLVDADHSYEGVRRDFEAWYPHVADGGLIIFHDYLMSDVARFVDEIVGLGEHVVASPGEVVPNVMAVTKRARRIVKSAAATTTNVRKLDIQAEREQIKL